MKQKLITVALFGAILLPFFACAETANSLDEVVVTATRTAQSADATLASVTVITRQDMERLQAQSLPDVLRGVAGLTISNKGGAGKDTSVYLRGTNSDHVLVLMDGIKVGSATNGKASFQDIPVAQIERIEIVRGPRASLYGSEAIGGVIQIFTRKGGGALAPSFSATAGSYGTATATVGLNGGGELGWFSARLNQQDIAGFNACNGKPSPGGAGCYVIEPDKDGYHNLSLGLNGGYRFDNNMIVDFNALQTDSFSKSDGSSSAGNETRAAQQVLGGSLKFSPLQAWNMTLRGGFSRDDSDLFFNGVYVDRYNTRRDSLSWQNDFALGAEQLLTAGLDYQQDRIESSRVYAQTARSNRALFGQYQGEFGAHSMQASLRRDDNQQFGGHNTGGLGYGYAINDAMRLTVSYGTAFKAPTFNQLYYPGFGTATNRPERSESMELGLSGRNAIGNWSLNAYQTDVTDLISGYPAVNVNKARLTGVEAQLAAQLAEWDIDTMLTLQDPRQISGANQGKLLDRRATESMRIEVARQFGDWRMASSLYAEGRRFDDLANTAAKRLGGYGLLDVRAEYRFAADWLLQGRIDNLLDKRYETAQYFNQPGRGVYFTLNYRPGN
ncbi:MAG: TonB-dependent vitamin B12 receptor [Gallionellales bacterium GWA2_60_18]|nr:MAG: TonB-dependent vitamin B12 receptor [Gallionellales bacterium GWA2_60_18]